MGVVQIAHSRERDRGGSGRPQDFSAVQLKYISLYSGFFWPQERVTAYVTQGLVDLDPRVEICESSSKALVSTL